MRVSEALEKLTDAVRVRHFPMATEKSYRLWLRSYMAVVRSGWLPLPAGEGGVRESGCEGLKHPFITLAGMAFLPHPALSLCVRPVSAVSAQIFAPQRRAGRRDSWINFRLDGGADVGFTGRTIPLLNLCRQLVVAVLRVARSEPPGAAVAHGRRLEVAGTGVRAGGAVAPGAERGWREVGEPGRSGGGVHRTVVSGRRTEVLARRRVVSGRRTEVVDRRRVVNWRRRVVDECRRVVDECRRVVDECRRDRKSVV